MGLALFVPIALQGLAMVVDEAYFHHRRGLPRWERIGHPLDTLTIIACLLWLLGGGGLGGYVALAIFSTLFVTKDEWIHATACSAGEQWLHAVLFALHPIVLAAFAYAAHLGRTDVLLVQLAVACTFLGYQVVYWNFLAPPHEASEIDNAWYADLGARWYTADDTPIALLRAEARHRNPWIAAQIVDRLGAGPKRVLDLGCGGGFLANYLAQCGHEVTGIDTTVENLMVARAHDPTRRVRYGVADACALPFADGSFDVVCAMDLLEHVDDPARLIAEASRVLAPNGLFVFHTFNRTRRAGFVVIKGVEWFVRNTPKHLHVYHLFRTPDEVKSMCATAGLDIVELRGARPRFTWPLWRMLATGRVGDDFAFTFTDSTAIGFTGIASSSVRAR